MTAAVQPYALLIPELLTNIFHHLPRENLPTALLVNRDWWYLAAPLLWKAVKSFTLLAKLLSLTQEVCANTTSLVNDECIISCWPQIPPPWNWDRFHIYSTFVRELHLSVNPLWIRLPEADAFLSSTRPCPLLPSLRILEIDVHGPDTEETAALLKGFISSGLVDVTLRLRERTRNVDPVVIAVVEALVRTKAELKRLSITLAPAAFLTNKADDEVRELISRQSTLQTIDFVVPSISSSTVQALGQLSALRALSIHLPTQSKSSIWSRGFEHLQEVSIVGRPEEVESFLASVRSEIISSLKIACSQRYIVPDVLQPPLKLLQSSQLGNLQSVNLAIRRWTGVRQLMCCSQLREVMVSVCHALEGDECFDDAALADMAMAWPNLERFVFGFPQDPPPVTLRGLVPFAEYCRKLRFLALSVDARSNPPKISRPLHTLQELKLTWSVANGKEDQVADFLAYFAPNLRLVGVSWRPFYDADVYPSWEAIGERVGQLLGRDVFVRNGAAVVRDEF